VNYWAPDQKCRRVTDAAELNRLRAKYGIEPDRPYAFGFAAADPRKNTGRILAAWALLSRRVRREHSLLLVGIQDSVMPGFRRQAADLGLDGQCLLHGFADEEDIPGLLSGSALLCYPSMSEGFGLPVLDAFKCGAAVLTSNTTSLPEVAGDAAVLVDSSSVESIARGLESLLTDAGLRKEMVRRGSKRVDEFTWDSCAKRAIEVFEKVLEEAR
jgi:glycosyltransferase involved in cell wall biosynthesis